MRVAIDGRTIVRTRSGIGAYAERTVRGLLRIDPDTHYFLFLVADVPDLTAPNLTKVVIEGYHRKGRNRWWENVLLPRFFAAHAIDVFFSPAYALPLLPRLAPWVRPLPLPSRWKAYFNTRRRPRYVVTIHDVIAAILPDTFTPKMRLWQTLFSRNAARLADRIIVVSEATRRDFVRLYHPEAARVVVVPNSVDPGYARVTDRAHLTRVKERYGLPDEFVLYLGTVEPRKNVTGLAAAYARLPEALRTRYPLVIAGSRGWYADQIVQQINSAGAADSVRFTGFVPHEDIPALYSLAKLFVYPSLYEGFGYPPLEAMACGVPVITSNVSSLPEVVGEAGIMVDPHDSAALATEMERVLVDDRLYACLRERGLERVRHFGWESTARQTLAVLQSASRA